MVLWRGMELDAQGMEWDWLSQMHNVVFAACCCFFMAIEQHTVR
jgi:hypothetical protein